MLSFLAGFVLVKFRLQEAKEEEENNVPRTKGELPSFQDPFVMLQCVGFRQVNCHFFSKAFGLI